jgi:hypothetical protein
MHFRSGRQRAIAETFLSFADEIEDHGGLPLHEICYILGSPLHKRKRKIDTAFLDNISNALMTRGFLAPSQKELVAKTRNLPQLVHRTCIQLRNRGIIIVKNQKDSSGRTIKGTMRWFAASQSYERNYLVPATLSRIDEVPPDDNYTDGSITILGASRLSHPGKEDPMQTYKLLTQDIASGAEDWRTRWFGRYEKLAREEADKALNDIEDVIRRYVPDERREVTGLTDASHRELLAAREAIISNYEKSRPLLPVIVIDPNRRFHVACPPKAKRGLRSKKDNKRTAVASP